MNEPVFYLRCRLCDTELKVPVGPEMHSEIKRRLIEHVESHTVQELAAYGRSVLLLAASAS